MVILGLLQTTRRLDMQVYSPTNTDKKCKKHCTMHIVSIPMEKVHIIWSVDNTVHWKRR